MEQAGRAELTSGGVVQGLELVVQLLRGVQQGKGFEQAGGAPLTSGDVNQELRFVVQLLRGVQERRGMWVSRKSICW